MKTFNKNIKAYFNYNKYNQHKTIYVINGNYVFTNLYSIVIMPINADKFNFKRIQELGMPIVLDSDLQDNKLNEDYIIIKNLNSYIKTFREDHFCEAFIPESETKDYFYLDDEHSFNKRYINNILKLLNGKGIFASENTNRVISLTGKNGYAFLLSEIFM